MFLKNGKVILYYTANIGNISILSRQVKDGIWLCNRGLNYIIFNHKYNHNAISLQGVKKMFLTPCRDIKYINIEMMNNEFITKSMSFTHNFICEYTVLMSECNDSGLLNYIKIERNNNYKKVMALQDDGLIFFY
jgi:hypothetical protein